MMEQYRGFYLYSGAESLSNSLLGRVSQWLPTGSIDYVRPAGSLVELTRFRFCGLTFDEKEIAEWCGLEIARLAVDSCYRELAIARYETEKRLVKQNRLRR
jgi:hypothetical protein